ncbi:MAG: flagellar biosynthesis protein FlhF [Planctomycetales bacterium]|nr:flagellar biosynthesis protein FlhF [Planctomycetales bacterium]
MPMDVKTYRARSMQQALEMVRSDLGPDAAVLHTRQLGAGVLRWLLGNRIEVTASVNVPVPSRLAHARSDAVDSGFSQPQDSGWDLAAAHPLPAMEPIDGQVDYRQKFRRDLQGQLDDLHVMVEQLVKRRGGAEPREMSESHFRLFTDLIDAELSEELARELLDRLQRTGAGIDDVEQAKQRLAEIIAGEIAACGPIRVAPGQRRLVALVGPTGVGKTTTIAKLAANFRLREKRRVGLITVDTYRIAAVEQLRTYADIMDLPMEVVATPREMRKAIAQFADMELILLDTAGRSPRDEVRIQELKSMLGEAQPDEVHLVLSSAASAAGLEKTAQSFSEVGATALLLTKLDEATGLGNLLPLLRSCRLPLSYLTNGQNVPDDIKPARSESLAREILKLEDAA